MRFPPNLPAIPADLRDGSGLGARHRRRGRWPVAPGESLPVQANVNQHTLGEVTQWLAGVPIVVRSRISMAATAPAVPGLYGLPCEANQA
jgi:hypothetical protein